MLTGLDNLFAIGLGKVDGKLIFLKPGQIHPLQTAFLVNIDKLAFLCKRDNRQHIFGLKDLAVLRELIENEFMNGLVKRIPGQVLDLSLIHI